MAFVHPQCLGKWLETRQSLRCDICNYNIQQTLKLKRMRKIARDLIKLLVKRLTRDDKFFVFKLVIYSAYIVLSCKKAVACYRMLVEQLRNNYRVGQAQLSQTILCVLYLLLILFQLAVFTSEEIRYFYRVLCKHLRLTCYEITFTDLERPKVHPEKPKQQS